MSLRERSKRRLLVLTVGWGSVVSACGGSSRARPSSVGGASGSATLEAGAAGEGAGGTKPSDVGGAGGSVAGNDHTGGAGSAASAGSSATAASAGLGGTGGTTPAYPLDMNDVTIVAPLPASTDTPVLLRATDLADDGTPLVPQPLVERLLGAGPLGDAIPTLEPVYEDLHLMAVRFDLCDRHLPGPCPEAEDARMRLVFQPLLDPPRAEDVGFHAFYAIRNDEIPDAVAALGQLAMMAPHPAGGLVVSPALEAANPEPYATGVREFVRRYGGEARLVRLTVNAQDLKSAAVAWILRGIEKKGSAFAEMTIAGSGESSERVVLTGNAGYDVVPMTDTPSGLQLALSEFKFRQADATSQGAALAALAMVENPLVTTAETVACVGCHVSTVVMSERAAGSALVALPGRYTSKWELSTAGGKSAETPRTLRALGYLGQELMISQRVVNDTAQVLAEIEQRLSP